MIKKIIKNKDKSIILYRENNLLDFIYFQSLNIYPDVENNILEEENSNGESGKSKDNRIPTEGK